MEEVKLKRNFIYNIIYQTSVYITPMVTAHHLGVTLGAELIGRYSFAQSIVSYFMLVAMLGTTYYGQREIAKRQHDIKERSCLFFEIVFLRVFNTIVAFVLFMAVVMPRAVDPRLYAIAALEILSVGVDISWLYQGMEDFGVIALTNSATKLISIILILVFVRTTKDLNLYVLIYCGAILAGFISQWLFLRGRVTLTEKPRLSMEKLHIRIALGLFVAQIAMQVYTVLDKTMIGLLTHSEIQNGYYEQAQKLIRVLVVVSTSVGTVMAARIAKLWGEHKTEEIRELVSLSFRFVCCISIPIFVGILLCADVFVPWYYGPGFDGVEELLCVLSLLPFVIGCSSVVGMQFFVPTGKERFLTMSVTAGSIVNLVLNSFFIIKWQALGAAIASVVAEITVTGIQFYIAKHDLHIKKVPCIALHYLLYCAPMAVVGFIVKRLTLNLGFCAAIVICACVVVYLAELVLFKDPLVTFILKNTGATVNV